MNSLNSDEFEALFLSKISVILDWMEVAFPEEGCGLLVQSSNGFEWIATKNVAVSPRSSFEVEPTALLAQLCSGKRIVCVAHSHVNSSAEFSETDLGGATYEGEGGLQELFPGARFLVVSVIESKAKSAKLYRFDQERYVMERDWESRLLTA